jgi:hypothetical protein
MRNYAEEQRVISFSEKNVFNAVKDHGLSLGLDLNPHALRNWCVSYWERKGEVGMVDFVLRHNSTKLKDSYAAPLMVEEVMGKQKIMEEELFERK